MTEESIWSFQPKPGDVVVFATADVITHGEQWGLQDRLKEAFPDNRSMIVSQHTTLSTRFEPFTEDELRSLRDCVFGHLTEKGDDEIATQIMDELEVELERRST